MAVTSARPIITMTVFAIAVAALAVFAAGCEQQQQAQATDSEETQMTDQGTQAAQGEIVKATTETFDAEVLQASLPVLVDFTADWCGPCRALHPTLEKIAADYAGRAKVVQVNVDAAGALASQYGVRGIPALFVFKGGQVVDQTVGLQSESQLKAMLNRHTV